MMRSASLLVVVLVACGSSTPRSKTVVSGSAANASDGAGALPAPSGTLHRTDVRQALSAGLGAFLQRVSFDVEHPVFRDHKFVGFRVTELKGAGWNGIDLKPGDVVTAVNGFSIERPEQAQQAFLSLAVASELRVDIEREGQARSIRLAINDD